MLGCMLRQDQSVYCENNSFNTLNDVAFQDTHATVSVPGDAWQLPSAKPAVGSLSAVEETVQDMMETLQQIIGDQDFTETLHVEPDELKCWESLLLKMSTTSCDPGEELSDILGKDILSFVEEQLQRDEELKLSHQLDDVPACLSSLDLHSQSPNQEGEQKCGWPQNHLTPGPGLRKLTHMDLSSTSGVSGPALQQISQQAAVGDTFTPSLLDSHTQAHNHMTLQFSSCDKNLAVFRQISQLQTSQQPLHMTTSNSQDHGGQRHLKPASSIEGNQFALQTHNSNNQRLCWPLQQQLIPNGPHQMSGLQRNPVPGVMNGSTFTAPDVSKAPFPVPQVFEQPSDSCMFSNVAVNGVHPSQPPSWQRRSHNPIQPASPCFYQELPVAVKGVLRVPEEAALSCQITTGLDANSLIFQPPYTNFSDQTQVQTPGDYRL